MFALKLQDKIPCSEIRKRTNIIDIIEYTLKKKWRRAGHNYSKNEGPNAAQSGNQAERRDQDDQAEDGKTT